MKPSARVSWSALLLAAVAALSCGGEPRPVAGALPPHTERWVLSPSALTSLSSDHETRGVQGELRLGDPFGTSALYLKFPDDWREHGRMVQAFLTLTPSDDAVSPDPPLSVEAWRVKTDWQPEQLHTWSDKPALGPPYATSTLPNTPARELRIDVSELVRFAEGDPERDFGLALLSRGGRGPAMSFASGIDGGIGPRLEVYLR